MSIRPYLSALRLSHLIGSNVVDGTGISAALSSSNASPMTTSLRQCLDAAASASHLSSMIRPSCVWVSPPPGGGTMRLRRRNPTAFSTAPFSQPE